MQFFADKTGYTHRGGFYGIPVYVDLSSEGMPIEGTNWIFDSLIYPITVLHNAVIEPLSQMFAVFLGRPYEPGFPLTIKGEL